MEEIKTDMFTELFVKIKENNPYFKKDKKAFKGSYTKGSTLLGAINPILNDHKVSLELHVTNQKLTTLQTQKWDKEAEKLLPAFKFLVELDLLYVFKDALGNKNEIKWSGSGFADDPAQAMGMALTYSERYFLTKQFQIPTDDLDPDQYYDGVYKDTEGLISEIIDISFELENLKEDEPDKVLSFKNDLNKMKYKDLELTLSELKFNLKENNALKWLRDLESSQDFKLDTKWLAQKANEAKKLGFDTDYVKSTIRKHHEAASAKKEN